MKNNNKFGVTELSPKEIKEINGGFMFFFSLAAGLAANAGVLAALSVPVIAGWRAAAK